MNNNYTFWWYEKAFPNYVCDKLIYYFEKQKENYRKGTVGKLDNKSVKDFSKQEMKELLDYRDSDIAWTEDQWLYNMLFPFIKDANQRAGWNYQYDRAESVQFTKYGKNGFYDWHCDSNKQPYGEKAHPNIQGKVRKLSMSVCLSDEKDYEGGDLTFKILSDKNKGQIWQGTEKNLRKKGSVCVFPSYVFHKVSPVTKGNRFSLVMWTLGNPWQ